MKKPSKPQSQIQEVLYFLLTRISIDRRQMMLSCGVLNLPNQILMLRTRYALKIELIKLKTKNKFGREIEYGKYKLHKKKKAALVYENIQAHGG